MKRSRKTLFALLLALVMTLGLAATAWATEVVPTDPFNLGLTITKIVEQTGDVTPPAETFTFVLEDWVKEGEKHDPAYYGITLEKLEISTATGNEITKTFAVQIDPEKVNAENGWQGYGNNTPSAPLRWYSKTFLLTEQNDGKAGWQYSAEEYAVTFQYTIETSMMNLTIHDPRNDVYYPDGAEFKNTYTGTTSTTPIRREKPNTPEPAITAPKTFDAGVALYGVSALLSLTGAALVIKRKNG